ncbi:MAG: cytidine deaminase [Calditrichaeota bacterium]|nr:cytidine deaminase [Calditrichota bacterium]
MDRETLIERALAATRKARVPYSHFPVGAALVTKSGKIYTGCNIESSSYSLTMCAERVALFKAISEGETQFNAIAITTKNRQLCPPCGACRQVLWDLAGDIDVILTIDENDSKVIKVSELLPEAFDEGFLPHEH